MTEQEELARFMNSYLPTSSSLIDTINEAFYKTFGYYPVNNIKILTDEKKISNVAKQLGIKIDYNILEETLVALPDNKNKILYILASKNAVQVYKNNVMPQVFAFDIVDLYVQYILKKYFIYNAEEEKRNIIINPHYKDSYGLEDILGYKVIPGYVFSTMITALSYLKNYKEDKLNFENIIKEGKNRLYNYLENLNDLLDIIISNYSIIFIDEEIMNLILDKYIKVNYGLYNIKSTIAGILLAKYFYQKYGENSLEILFSKLKEYKKINEIIDEEIIEYTKKDLDNIIGGELEKYIKDACILISKTLEITK